MGQTLVAPWLAAAATGCANESGVRQTKTELRNARRPSIRTLFFFANFLERAFIRFRLRRAALSAIVNSKSIVNLIWPAQHGPAAPRSKPACRPGSRAHSASNPREFQPTLRR